MKMGAGSVPGFFGKIAGAGDFVQRRLPPDFIDAWDRAFSRAVAESRDLMGAGWQAEYRGSPAWRFLLAPGACGKAAWAGVTAPAVDRVGRSFPMVVAGRLDGGPAQPGVLYDDGRWFAAVEAMLHASLDDRGLGAEAFDDRVAALVLPLAPDEPTLPLLPRSLDPARRGYWLALQEPAVPLLKALWAHLAADGCGLWWCEGCALTHGRAWIGRGLPDTAAYLAFLRVRSAARDTAGHPETAP